MDTRDIYKLVRELSEERDDVINLYDSVDIELNESFVIETGVVGFKDDGIVLHLDEDAVDFLQLNGILNESSSSDAAYSAILNRIMRQHPELLSKYGPSAVQYAIEDVANGLDDLEEIGSSDVSIWVKYVIQDLESGNYSNLDEEMMAEDAVSDFKNKLSRSNDPFEMIYGAISGDYGEEIRLAMQDMYDDVVNDSGYRLHPDDDFEKIINIIVDQLVDDSDNSVFEELTAIRKLALGESEEVDEGAKGIALGVAALIAAGIAGNKIEANHLMKSEPQLVTLAQMKQEAEQRGDAAEVEELEDRIEKTLDHIRVTGRPVMDPHGEPVDPRKPYAGESVDVDEAKYQGREVPLGKPMQGDVKKSKVYVRKPNGKVVKVNFGDKNMRIKKNSPGHRKSFRARHHCENPGPRWKARYWSCRAW